MPAGPPPTMQQVVLGIGIGGMRVARVGWEVKRWAIWPQMSGNRSRCWWDDSQKSKSKIQGSVRSEMTANYWR